MITSDIHQWRQHPERPIENRCEFSADLYCAVEGQSQVTEYFLYDIYWKTLNNLSSTTAGDKGDENAKPFE